MNHSSRCRFKAFTLVEMLVVVAIIAVLVALLLPAVQQAREAARRSRCQNNLKQLSLAMHNYHDIHNILPPGFIQAPITTLNQFTWVAMILPMIDQAAMYEKLIFDNGANIGSPTGTNKEIAKTKISTMTCPSDPYNWKLTYDDFYARGNYGANAGMGPMKKILNMSDAKYALEHDGVGPFEGNSRTRIADFLDGVSNTVLIGELRTGKDSFDFRGVLHYPEGPFINVNEGPNSVVPDLIRNSGCPANASPPCTGNFTKMQEKDLIHSSRSLHAGGVQLALADGAVRFVSENIALNIWQNLGIHNDGNSLGEF